MSRGRLAREAPIQALPGRLNHLRMIAMTRGRVPTLLLVGSIALTLSGCASYSGYAPAPRSGYGPAAVGNHAYAAEGNYGSDSVASACLPYDDGLGCDYGDPYGFYDYGGYRGPDDGRHDYSRHEDYHADGHVKTYDFGHGGFDHDGFGHGGYVGGGHGR